MGGGIGNTLGAYAAANPRNTPVGDALGTFGSSLIDWVSRPSYVVGNLIKGEFGAIPKNALNFFVPGTQALEAIAGARTSPSMALTSRGVDFGGGLGGAAGRFAADVLLDPVTYLTLGTGAAIKGGATIGARALKAVENVTNAAGRPILATPAQINTAFKSGFINKAQVRALNTKRAPYLSAERVNQKRIYEAEQGGKTVVGSFRRPGVWFTPIRAKNIPMFESKTLGKVVKGINPAARTGRVGSILAEAFTPHGGKDPAAYQAYLGASNAGQGSKSVFGKEASRVEREAQRAGKAAGINPVQSSNAVVALYLLEEIMKKTAKNADGTKAVDEAGRAFQRFSHPEVAWKALNDKFAELSPHKIGGRPRIVLPAYADAVRAFGDPFNIADGTVLGSVRRAANELEDYALTAGVKMPLHKGNYLIQLPASPRDREILQSLLDVDAVAVGARKTQEGFTMERRFQTILDALEAGITPEMGIGNLLTKRGNAGVNEAVKANTIAAWISMYGVRGPLPNTAALEDAYRAATEVVTRSEDTLGGLLRKPETGEALMTVSDARKNVRLADKALAVARKSEDADLVAEAMLRLDNAIEAEKALSKGGVPWVGKTQETVEGIRNIKIKDAVASLKQSQEAATAAMASVSTRIMDKAMETIRELRKSNPEIAADEAAALSNAAIDAARVEVQRLEVESQVVVHAHAREARAGKAATNKVAKEKAKGKGSVRTLLATQRTKLRKEMRRQEKEKDFGPEGQEKLRVIKEKIAVYEEDLAYMAKHNIRDAPTLSERREIAVGGKGGMTADEFVERAAAGTGRHTNVNEMLDEDFGKISIFDYYGSSLQSIVAGADLSPLVGKIVKVDKNGVPTTKGGKSVVITQEMVDKAVVAANDLPAAQDMLTQLSSKADELDFGKVDELGFVDRTPAQRAAFDDAKLDNEMFGTPMPDEVLPQAGPQAAQNVPMIDTASMPLMQRQLVEWVRGHFGTPVDVNKNWAHVRSVKGGRISVGGNVRGVTVSPEALAALERQGIITVQPTASGKGITAIRPGPKMLAEGAPGGQSIKKVQEGTIAGMESIGAREIAGRQLRVVEARTGPIKPDEVRIASLTAEIDNAKKLAVVTKILERQSSDARILVEKSKTRLRDAKNRPDKEAIRDAETSLNMAQKAEDAAAEALAIIRKKPDGRVVVKAEQAVEHAKDVARAAAKRLAEAEAAYQRGLMFSGRIVDQEDWVKVRETWTSFTDRQGYWGEGGKANARYPEGATLIDPVATPQINRTMNRIDIAVKDQTALRKIGRFIRGLTRAWKGLVLATPGYHMRNMMDDGLRAYWAGARNPVSYIQAIRFLRGKGGSVKIQGKTYSRDEFIRLAESHGIIGTGSQYHAEAVPLYERHAARWLGGRISVSQPSQGRIATASQRLGAFREDTTRLGTFMELMKNGEHEVIAAATTREFLFDYNDTSEIIRASKDFWMPFITYSFKAVPFYARGAVQRPGQVAALGYAMRDMTAAAEQDYGPLDMSLMAPGSEMSFAVPRLPFGISEFLNGSRDTPGTIDPSSFLGIGALNQLSPITFPGGNENETAIGAALGTIPKGLARVASGYVSPLVRAGTEIAFGQDARFGSPLPPLTRSTPVTEAWRSIGGPLPGYGPKKDSYTGQTVPGVSTNFMRMLALIPPLNQTASYMTAASAIPGASAALNIGAGSTPIVSESDQGRVPFLRTLFGIPYRPFDVSRAMYYASRNGR